jgi:hypothetical protein
MHFMRRSAAKHRLQFSMRGLLSLVLAYGILAAIGSEFPPASLVIVVVLAVVLGRVAGDLFSAR